MVRRRPPPPGRRRSEPTEPALKTPEGDPMNGGWNLDGAVRIGNTVTEGLLAVGYSF